MGRAGAAALAQDRVAIRPPAVPHTERIFMINSGTTALHDLDGRVRLADGVAVADLAGELDLARAPALRELLLGLLRPGSSRLVLDLSRVSFCDASGLAVLVGTARRARLLGGFVRLAAVSPPVALVLELTGLHRHLPVFPSVHAAATTPMPDAERGQAA